MARIRTIKPEFWTDERIVDLSPYARLLFLGMLNFADDDGYTENKPRQIKMRVLPADDVNPDTLLDELIRAGLLDEWHDPDTDTNLLLIRGFAKHQQIKNRSLPRYPNAIPHPSHPHHHHNGILPQPSPSPTEGIGRTTLRKGREGKGKEKNPPTPRTPNSDVRAVFDHWLAATRRSPAKTLLTTERRRVIEARLRDYPVADLIAAIDGNQFSAFHQGDNDRGKVYDDLTLILRNGTQLEKFRDLATQPTPQGPAIDEDAVAAAIAKLERADTRIVIVDNGATG